MANIVQDINVLRQKSEDVSSVEEAQDLIEKLEDAINQMDNGVGLAAIQLGYPKRVGVIKKQNGKFLHLINPELVEGLDEFDYFREGCLSFPDIFMTTRRYEQITIKHKRIENGKFEDETFVSFYDRKNPKADIDAVEAIAIQHEIDHFNGKLIYDHDVKLEPMKRDGKKVGRNDPCPCGKKDSSGKPIKYKKCCGKAGDNK